MTELYEGFTYEHGPDLVASYAAGAAAGRRATAGLSGRVAVESASVPVRTLEVLGPVGRPLDHRAGSDRARAIKTAEEIAALGKAGRDRGDRTERLHGGGEAGPDRARRLCLRSAAPWRAPAGERLPRHGRLPVGARAEPPPSPAGPTDRTMRPGDPVISDLAPRVGGYWGDSCASNVLGEPDEPYLRLFEAARSGLDLALSIMRPGLAIADLDRQVRAHVAGRVGRAYPHHTGHSLGTSVHEWPRLVPYEEAALQAGMVLMVEPGAYDPEVGGVRTEHMVEITTNGCRVLTEFEHHPSIAP